MIVGLIGMVHLGPLPGSPAALPLPDTVATAVRDARALADAGFDALMIENFGDAPFYADTVPTITATAMTRAIGTIVDTVEIPVGVNVLRNDGVTALAVAAATGASFVRINVLSGTMFTDQGPIVGRAAEIARLKATIAPSVAILADVMVKHATPPAGLSLAQAAADLWERGGADGIVVSGDGTGRPTDPDHLDVVARAVPTAPLYVGSGATDDTVKSLLDLCAGVIVGTATKRDGIATNPVDPDRARAIVEAAG